MHWHVKRGASNEIADIHVAGKLSRRHAAIASRFLTRDGDRTRERLKRNHDAGKELGRHLVKVEIKILNLAIRIECWEFAEHAGNVEVRGVGAGHDLVERHLQHIARLRALDIDGPRQRVRPTTGKIRPRLLDLFNGRAWNHLVVAVHHGFEDDGVAGIYPKHRWLGIIEPAPLGGVERRRQ